MRRALLRRSWGEGDVLRSGRLGDFTSSTPPSIATPLRGPLRASAESAPPSRCCISAGCREARNDREIVSGKQQPRVVDDGGIQGEKNDDNSFGELPFNAVSASPRHDGNCKTNTTSTPDRILPSTPTHGSQVPRSTPADKPHECSTPCNSGPHAKASCVDGAAEKLCADSAPATHTPSASVATGYIRARQRTPQTSLGPAKRVPLSERLPSEGHDRASAPRCKSAEEAVGQIAQSRRSATFESGGGGAPQPRISRTSPKSVAGKGPSARKEGGAQDDNVATAVADVWALTEGLRRSAQIALNASSSSG